MARAEIDTRQWEQVRRLMTQVMTTDAKAIMDKGGQAAGATFDQAVRSELPPPVRRQAAAPYWTDKQRRWWWGTMHAKARGQSKALPGWKAVYRRVEGRKTLVISGAYRRTNTLVRSLTYAVTSTASAVSVTYGTNRLYAKYVLDRTDQAQYHKGNWKTLQQFAEDQQDAVRVAFESAAGAEFEKRWERP